MALSRAVGKRLSHDPSAMLIASIQALAGSTCCVTLQREQPWASVTFSGIRQLIIIACSGPDKANYLGQLASQLPDHDFAMTGHFVADVLIKDLIEDRLSLEILTLIDPRETELD
jgi:hypothetical protein